MIRVTYVRENETPKRDLKGYRALASDVLNAEEGKEHPHRAHRPEDEGDEGAYRLEGTASH